MSIERFAAAEAALKAGDSDEGIRLITEELERDPKAPVGIYRNFASMLFRRNDFVKADRWASAGVALYPKDYDLWNILGVSQRRQKKYDSAIKSLKQAERINPKNTSALQNRGNIYNDLRNGPPAIEVFTKLVRLQPSSAEIQRSLGRGYWYSGDFDKAIIRMNLALKLKSDYADAWLDLAAVTADAKGYGDALVILDQALATTPTETRLMEARVTSLRRTGRLRDAEAYLIGLLGDYGEQAWLHYQLGGVISDYDRRRGNDHLEKAVSLAPDNLGYRIALIESLARSRHGDEAAHLERAYTLLKDVLPPDTDLNPAGLKVSFEVLIRLADYEAAETLGTFAEVGRTWAESGKHTALFGLLARMSTPEDRLELVNMHRIWGDAVTKAARKWPLSRPEPRAPNGKIRVGFMSSDLRRHPVAYFALPLFEHYDRSRFEVYCYSYYEGQEDPLQKSIGEFVDAFRWRQDMSEHAAAQMIADDQLDILIELGGSTHMNKLGVMAFKPAPLQASWLGYPHSAGPSTIDYIVLDPYLVPTDSKLLIEKPLLMPKSWLALASQIFTEAHAINEMLPEDRNGYITFGTANNPHKYSKRLLQAWARVVRDVPNSRFEFIRPEGNAPSFKRNIEQIFEAEGVSADRLVFRAVRGTHMQHYNDVDITLDPFPLTGGTSTCEALWMGVPVVNLRGEALPERLSGSILSNLGLKHHIADTLEAYHAIAVTLAADRTQRQDLRSNLRQRMKDSPLGQTDAFAQDFYDMVEGAVRAGNTR